VLLFLCVCLHVLARESVYVLCVHVCVSNLHGR
jgi:hypothetical protein